MTNPHSQDDDSGSPPENIIPPLSQSATESGNRQQQQKRVKQKQSLSPADRMRLVIVCLAVLLVIAGIVLYIKTGNAQLLVGTSVLTYPLMRIVDYYFDRRQK
jgi:hypothetical protein